MSVVLALSLFGIIAGNALIGASGGWGNNLTWGATVTLGLVTALAGIEAAHHRGWGPAPKPMHDDETFDLTSELSRIGNPRGY